MFTGSPPEPDEADEPPAHPAARPGWADGGMAPAAPGLPPLPGGAAGAPPAVRQGRARTAAPVGTPVGKPLAARITTIAAGLATGCVAGALSALLALPGAAGALAAGLPAPLGRLVRALDGPGLAALAPAPPAFAVALAPVRRAVTEAGAALEVAGEIRNLTSIARAAPTVELLLLDAHGRALEVIRLPADGDRIAPGGRAGFSTIALHPPAETARVVARVGEAPLDRL